MLETGRNPSFARDPDGLDRRTLPNSGIGGRHQCLGGGGRGYVVRCFAALSRTSVRSLIGDRTAPSSRCPSAAPLVAHSSARHPRRLVGAEPGVPRAHGVRGRDREPIRGRAVLRPQVSIRAARDRPGHRHRERGTFSRVLDRVAPRSRTAGVDAEVEDPQADAMVAQGRRPAVRAMPWICRGATAR